jgi:hypothetical protein
MGEAWLQCVTGKEMFGDPAYGKIGVGSVILVRPKFAEKESFLASLTSHPENTSKRMRAVVGFEPEETADDVSRGILVEDVIEIGMSENVDGPDEALRELLSDPEGITEVIVTLAKNQLSMRKRLAGLEL